MRNAGPIDSPTDPFSSVPLPSSGTTSRRPRIEGLPPGVSPDIFGPPAPQPRPAPPPGQGGPANGSQNGGAPDGADDGPAGGPGKSALPPMAAPVQPWPVSRPRAETSRAATFGLPEQPDPSPVLLEPEPSRRGRLLPAVLVVVVVLALLAYLVPAVLMAGSVLRGTRVGGVDIGGLTVTQAADKLRDKLGVKLNKPVTVDIGGQKEIIQAEDAGLELDVVGTIGQARSGFPGPMEVWRGLTGTTDLEPKVTLDLSQLTRTVEGLAESHDKVPREGRVAFAGLRPVVTEPRDGVLLDRDDAVRAIDAAFRAGRNSVVLALRPAHPESTPATVAKARALAERAVAAPITLALGGRQAQIPPATIAASLTFTAGEDGELVPRFDAEKALATVEKGLIDEAQAPRDATYDIVNGRPVLVPARAGRGVDPERLADDVAKVVAGQGSRVIPVKLATVKPAVATSQVSGLGIKENVGEFTTTFECCQPRATNIQRMAADLDGVVVRPGQTFSLNDATGERTREGGYVEAGQIVGGRLVNIVGGGVSQFATTLYNAAYFAGFEEVERTPMDYYAVRYPAGRDAALLYPDRDLKWRNDSDYGVLIKTAATGTSVTVTLWSTRRYDKVQAVESEKRDFTPFRTQTSSQPGCVPTAGAQGFTIDVTRVFVNDGKEVKRDRKQTTKYRPQAQVICAAE
ncbi:VanW family protein [Nonomuraea roseoviolacea]|uniref:Vancomycin resistance protein YoaR n=1 Tax=Nonomuraea roseoviolacea subsp. carminata TaxID=160689 RepID=A0ABT1K458_9ACTN|nr:VanW family protein [Nonomuraea roseoviolacea]MCP2348797.1 vancomycin resistance protein YoaR [Nonomuraea roseoviolacea subsp. carminata]